MAEEGRVTQALTEFTRLLLMIAHEAGMSFRTRGTNRNRVPSPFYDSECKRLKKEWREAGRCYGYHVSQVKALERTYHSYVRSRKRIWMLTQLQDCIHMVHSCPRKFWQTFRGTANLLPRPLQSHYVWETFLHTIAPPNPAPTPLDPAQLSPLAYPWVESNGSHLNTLFTIQEVEEGIMALNTARG
jgi:hypothetical protein